MSCEPKDAQLGEGLESLMRQIVADSIHVPAPVNEEPICALERWRILAWSGGRHFVGYHARQREGRVSSAICELDPHARTGVTASGRRYVLVGPPGHDPDAEYVLHWWLRANEVPFGDIRDVTAEVIPNPGQERTP